MPLKDKVSEAKSLAIIDAVRDYLKKENNKLGDLSRILNKHYSLELILTKQDEDWLLVLPVHAQNKTTLEEEVASAVYKGLENYEPRETEFDGYVAYKVRKKLKDKFPSTLKIEAYMLKFQVKVVRLNLGIQPKLKPLIKGAYRPPVKEGDVFVVELSSQSEFRYNLIYLRKGTRRNFPGYRVPFDIVHDKGRFTTHVASAPKGTKIGELNGCSISSGIKNLYQDYLELKEAKQITFKVVEPGKVYQIVGAR